VVGGQWRLGGWFGWVIDEVDERFIRFIKTGQGPISLVKRSRRRSVGRQDRDLPLFCLLDPRLCIVW
jgi:hypothetical protein